MNLITLVASWFSFFFITFNFHAKLKQVRLEKLQSQMYHLGIQQDIQFSLKEVKIITGFSDGSKNLQDQLLRLNTLLAHDGIVVVQKSKQMTAKDCANKLKILIKEKGFEGRYLVFCPSIGGSLNKVEIINPNHPRLTKSMQTALIQQGYL